MVWDRGNKGNRLLFLYKSLFWNRVTGVMRVTDPLGSRWGSLWFSFGFLWVKLRTAGQLYRQNEDQFLFILDSLFPMNKMSHHLYHSDKGAHDLHTLLNVLFKYNMHQLKIPKPWIFSNKIKDTLSENRSPSLKNMVILMYFCSSLIKYTCSYVHYQVLSCLTLTDSFCFYRP